MWRNFYMTLSREFAKLLDLSCGLGVKYWYDGNWMKVRGPAGRAFCRYDRLFSNSGLA
jgi:hypothetical protein